MQENNNEKKIKIAIIIYAILIVLVAAIGVSSILAYGTNTAVGKKIAAKISKIIPFPAAIIDHTNFIYWDDVEKNLASIENFYKSQDLSEEGLRIDFTTPDGEKRLEIKKKEIFNKLVEDRIIEILAKEKGISISDKEVDKIVGKKLAEYGTSEDIKSDLLDSYGWTLEDFKKKVVLPSAYKEALAFLVIQENSDNSIAKKKIEQAKKDLESGKDFAEVAKKYSDGSSNENGGELGWVKKAQVVKELQDSFFGSKSPEKNSIIESSLGFHIIEVENRKKEDNEDVLQLKQIFVSKDIFVNWLQDQKKQISVIVFPAGFSWNNSEVSVDFKSEDMKTFEKEERAKLNGDASIMF